MLNIYSNYAPGNQIHNPDIIQKNGSEYIKAIKSVDPDVKIWLAVAAFKEPGIFQRPAATELARDIRNALNLPDITGIGFYLWGPIHLDANDIWYLPESGADLWDIIQHYIQSEPISTPAVTAPDPVIVNIDVSPPEVRLGDYTEITVKVRNDGSSAEWQTISLSFPQNISDISVTGHDLSDAGIYPQDYIGWRDYGTAQDRKFLYPLVEGYRGPWLEEETGYLTVKVKPEASGEFKFYVKTVAGRQPDGKCVSWDPESGERDQQGEFVYTKTFSVISPPR